ncbi:MAG: DUF4136 domain-containing protein [Alphaproteobacteria bacterium]|nr:MAG: DUF4136 domain-containing protein [Alphaproteobacteria bacterium]
MFRRLVILVLVALAGACTGPQFEAEVTRFHVAGLSDYEGKRIRVEPARDDIDGVVFARYAAMLGERLAALGFVPAGKDEPDWLARLDYSVTATETAPESGAQVGIGAGHFGRHVGVSGAFGFPIGGHEPEAVYNRRISLALIEAESGRRLWEGRAVSTGRTADLDAVMPLLIKALLEGFPGESGRTVEVRLPVEGRQ